MATADLSESLPREYSPRWIVSFTACCIVGLVCITLDETVQPSITKIGRVQPIHTVAKLWQELGSTCGIVLFIAAAGGCVPIDQGRTFTYFVVSVSAAGLSVQVLKRIIGRVRPYVAHDTTTFFGPLGVFDAHVKGPIDSMPSGHTAAAFAMAVALAHRWPRAKWLWYGLAVGVGVSRSLMDAHFPSDVILGACLGTVIGLLIIWFFEFRKLGDE